MVFTIYGHVGHLGHVTRTIWTNFRSPILRSLHMKFEFNWPRFQKRRCLKMLTEDGRRSHWYTLFCLFCCFTSQINSYGHCGTVSSPNHTFSWAGLKKRLTSNLCTYSRFVTDNNPSWINQRKGEEWPAVRRICSQTRYRLRGPATHWYNNSSPRSLPLRWAKNKINF